MVSNYRNLEFHYKKKHQELHLKNFGSISRKSGLNFDKIVSKLVFYNDLKKVQTFFMTSKDNDCVTFPKLSLSRIQQGDSVM